MRKDLPATLKKTGERISFWAATKELGWVVREGEVFKLFGVRVVVHHVGGGRRWAVSEPTLGLRFPKSVGGTKAESLVKAHRSALRNGGRRWWGHDLIALSKLTIRLMELGPKPRRAAVAGEIVDRSNRQKGRAA